MRAVIDTNVVAYYLLGTQPFVEEATRFWREVESPVAPALWEAELANVVWMATRAGILNIAEGRRRLNLASRLAVRSVASRTLWQGALVRAIRSDIAVYDTLFVELAVREGIRLATFDTAVLKAFPTIAARPGTLVAVAPQ